MLVGLAAFGVSIAFQVRAGLGLDPWDVFHQGIARRTGLSIGTCVVIVGAVVLALWIPLRLRPGVGTVSNVIVIGVAANAALQLLPQPTVITSRLAFLAFGIVLCGVATGAYIGTGLGPGPRDGLMVGLARRGYSIRVVRTLIEASVLVLGYLLGGTVGVGTVVFALAIGPLAHITIPFFSRPPQSWFPRRTKETRCASD
jgi:uncharacterized membrane protein YczE